MNDEIEPQVDDYERVDRDYGRETGPMALDDLRSLMDRWVHDHEVVLNMRRPDDPVDVVVECVKANMLAEYLVHE